ncbi:MAG TPA: DUF779 domain-containing protein [Crenotrichaceae bacterium]|nr:DUF779 domain-containing protein [Crenotrichaceae bacterium]
MPTDRVSVTDKAKQVIDKLRLQHGRLLFHQSGGCCDGSAPMCLSVNDFIIGSRDIYLGEIHGCPFYMAADQFEYWKNSHLTIDVTEGRGASFSLEIPLGLRFIVISRLFTETEFQNLSPIE